MSAVCGGAAVIVRQYQSDAPAGLIGDWLTERGVPWQVSRREAGGELPAGATAVVALGSSASAYWADPAWIERERELIGRTVADGVPVLGICFGAQVLARALGGTVARAARPELGWVRPQSTVPELCGPYLAWHFDAIELPPGATALAATPDALQAFSSAAGDALGLQFHPEVTPPIWAGWAAGEPDSLRRHVRDPDALRAEVARGAAATRTRVFALLDWWRRGLGGAL